MEKVKTIFKIVKGLSGRGVSFMVKKDKTDYYLVNKLNSEDISLEQKQENGEYKKNATF